jgi:hypothetical protein
MKVRPLGAELFRADGRTDRLTKLVFAFRNVGNTPNNGSVAGDENACVRSGRMSNGASSAGPAKAEHYTHVS